MTRKITPIGIDIGSSGVKIAQLKRASNTWMPRALERQDWDENCAVDDMAFGDTFTDALRAALQASGVKGKRAVVSAPADLVDIRPITVPVSEQVDLATYVQTELLDRHAESADDFVTDFWVTGEVVEHGETKIELYSASARCDRVTSLVQAVERAGLTCVRVEVAATALGHSIDLAATERASGPVVIVDFGERISQLLALNERGISFCRLFNWGSRNIAENIKTSLDIDWETAKQLMIDWGLRPVSSGGTGADGQEVHPRQQQINDCIEQELRILALEIGRSLAYRARSTAGGEVTALGVVGGGSHLFGLARFIRDALKLDVRPASILSQTDHWDRQSTELAESRRIGSYGVAIGAALAGVN